MRVREYEHKVTDNNKLTHLYLCFTSTSGRSRTLVRVREYVEVRMREYEVRMREYKVTDHVQEMNIVPTPSHPHP